MRRKAVAVLLALFLASPLLAQEGNAALTGFIQDSSKAVIQDVHVLAINTNTNQHFEATTGKDGSYNIASLPVGPYRMQIDRPGFRTILKEDIFLHTQDVLQINFQMAVGSSSETITVSGESVNINTTDASVGTTIDRKFVENLPLNGRSFNMLLQLTPGVVTAPVSDATGGQFSVAGQRSSANNFTVDGVSANFGIGAYVQTGGGGTGSAQAFSAIGGTSSLVSVDALQEFKVETSSFAPEFGRSPGGQVSMSTRSGTNDFHGNLFDYFRNDAMDANDWFANHNLAPRADERHNDFGGTLGGPIFRDRTFFFFSYEGARLRLPQTTSVPVPPLNVRNSALPTVKPFLITYPIANPLDKTQQLTATTFTGTFSNQATLDAISIRIDHTFNSRFSAFARYNDAPSKRSNRTDSLNVIASGPANVRTATVGMNMVLSTRMTNSFRVNFSSQESGLNYTMDNLGGAIPIDPEILLAPFRAASNYASFIIGDGGEFDVGLGGKNGSRQFNFVDDLAITRGSHQFKFGGDYRVLFTHKNAGGFFIQGYSDTSQHLADTATTEIDTENAVPPKYLSNSFSFYGQDTWKLTHRLTLTYGLRWEINPFPTAEGNTKIVSWLNIDNPSELALAPPGTPAYPLVLHNFAPRVGAAYALNDSGNFVLRAGFGTFYDLGLGSASDIGRYFPNFAEGTYLNVKLPYTSSLPFVPPYPTYPLKPPFGFTFAITPNPKTPISYQWNVALEKAFGKLGVFTTTYVGQAGREQLRQAYYDQPNANFNGAFAYQENDAFSNYNALQAQFRRPLANGLQLLLNYTWSHSMDNASSDAVVGGSDLVIDASRDYGNSDFDVRQSFSGALTYDIPGFKTNRLSSAVTSDWSLDSVIVARTGFPITAFESLYSPTTGDANLRPDLVPGQPVWIPQQSAGGGKVLNPNAFNYPTPIRQGDEPRNYIPGFGLSQVDLSLARKFAFTERFNLLFRTDAFNFLNHPDFSNPYGYTNYGPLYLRSVNMLNHGLGGLSPLFQEGGPRSLQLSLKLQF